MICSGLAPATWAQQAEMEKAEALLKAGNPAAAYTLLEPLDDKYAGDARFDYLLGIAALDSGKADKATLAFERVLAVNPNFAGARLDMARAYFHLGDLARAKTEFETVLQQNPPPAARLTVERYLKAIEERSKIQQTQISGFAEFGFGHDTNVNNSSAATSISVPALGNIIFTLDPRNVQKKDNYTSYALGADVNHILGQGFAVSAGASTRYRVNSTEDTFDYNNFEGHGGVSYATQSALFRLGITGERFYLDHAVNRNSTGINGDARYMLDPANVFLAFAQHNRFRFEQSALTINNFDQSLLGGGYLRLFADGAGAITANAFVGTEKADSGRADGNKDITGIRLGGQYRLRDDLDLFASFGGQRGKYDKENVAFQKLREDRQSDAVIGLTWRYDKDWTVRPQILRVRNDSNIEIYGYSRMDYSVTIRRDFK
ncbi:MAG: tetratricopeptide repeat protein [Burkholderiales bacterium]|nr:tetratricopeptide repeat protein [Burkholderiales bacterium]